MISTLRNFLRRFPFLVRLHDSCNELLERFYPYLPIPQRPKATPLGFKLQGCGSVHHRSMQQGTFEVELTQLLLQRLEQAQVFVDVGANIGLYSCLARSKGKHVIAVEPLPRNTAALYTNMFENGWKDVEVFPVGLSRTPGIAVLYGASSTGASLIGNWAGASGRHKRIIPISTLDVILGSRFSGKPMLIKIDVEGVEFMVLSGAVKTLSQSPRPTWVMEICLNEFHPSGLNPDYLATFELFWSHG